MRIDLDQLHARLLFELLLLGLQLAPIERMILHPDEPLAFGNEAP